MWSRTQSKIGTRCLSEDNTEDNRTQHDTIRYDTMWSRTQSKIGTRCLSKCFSKISKQFLFSRNRSVSKRNISFSRIRDQKAMNLLLDVYFCREFETIKESTYWSILGYFHKLNTGNELMNLLLIFWPLSRTWDHIGVNFLPHIWLFSRIWGQKEWIYSFIFGHFHGFQSRKEWKEFSAIFSYFHEFETQQQWTYCPICDYFHEFESKKYERFVWFLIFFTTRKTRKACIYS